MVSLWDKKKDKGRKGKRRKASAFWRAMTQALKGGGGGVSRGIGRIFIDNGKI